MIVAGAIQNKLPDEYIDMLGKIDIAEYPAIEGREKTEALNRRENAKLVLKEAKFESMIEGWQSI